MQNPGADNNSDSSSGEDEDHLEDVGDQRPASPVVDNTFSDSRSESDSEPESSDEEEPPAQPLSSTYISLQEKLEGELKAVITAEVCMSPGEVLLNAMELVKQHNLPHDVHANLLKLVNSLFKTSVVPDTRYLLDELFVSSSGIQYHFYCLICKDTLPPMDFKASGSVQCTNEDCKFMNSMKSLRDKNSYFVTFDIPTQLKILFNCAGIFDALKSPDELARENINVMKDLYGGFLYQAFVQSLDLNAIWKYLSFCMCIDGAPLFNSSGCQVHPLFLSINELPPHLRMRRLILAGFWFGETKPNYPCIFEVFVEHMKKLSNEGCVIDVNGERLHFKCYCIACCVDSGARGAVQGIHQHNGEFGCSWCLHRGERVGGNNNARMYCKVNPPPLLRSKEELIEDGRTKLLEGLEHVNGVTGVSFLASLPKFNIVDGMIVDCLHGKFLGVARQFAKVWMGTEGIEKVVSEEDPRGVNPPFYIGTPANTKKINKRITSLTPTVETRRMPREISEVKYYKGRDWENYVLYFSVLLFKGILPEAFLNHWILYVQACYLLMHQALSHEEVDIADGLLDSYTSGIETLYKNGDASINPQTPCKQMKFNVHLLDHAARNAHNWGPDFGISSYCYEGGNYDTKKKIKSNKGIAKQIIRHYSQDMSISLMKCSSANTPATQHFSSIVTKHHVSKSLRVGKYVLLGSIQPLEASEEEEFLLRNANLDPEDFIQCSKVIRDHCVFTVEGYEKASRRNNSVVQLCDNSFAVIRKIISCETTSEVFAFSSIIRTTPYHTAGIAHVPSHKRFLHSIILTQEEKKLHSFDQVRIVCVRSNVGPLGNTLAPMANIHTIS